MNQGIDPTLSALCDRLERLFTPAICDALDRRGLRQQTMVSGFMPVLPRRAVAGPAFTVREIATAQPKIRSVDEKLRIFADFFGAVHAGEVVVVDTGGAYTAAAWGELMSTISKYTCGARGAVVDGALRDISRIIEVDFPVWGRGNIPTDSEGRIDLLGFNQPIRCGEVLVRPGDIVFADMDGIVVIPPDQIDLEGLVSEAEEIVEGENKSRAELKEGMAPLDVFKKYGRL
ncbi:MAG: RraA family protein [Anaerolineae bacterium]|nr:RraA family protein [Anaerolineae bacterium]